MLDVSITNRQLQRALVILLKAFSPTQIIGFIATASHQAVKEMHSHSPAKSAMQAFAHRLDAIYLDEEQMELTDFLAKTEVKKTENLKSTHIRKSSGVQVATPRDAIRHTIPRLDTETPLALSPEPEVRHRVVVDPDEFVPTTFYTAKKTVEFPKITKKYVPNKTQRDLVIDLDENEVELVDEWDEKTDPYIVKPTFVRVG
jgi:hypothetical protein